MIFYNFCTQARHFMWRNERFFHNQFTRIDGAAHQYTYISGHKLLIYNTPAASFTSDAPNKKLRKILSSENEIFFWQEYEKDNI